MDNHLLNSWPGFTVEKMLMLKQSSKEEANSINGEDVKETQENTNVFGLDGLSMGMAKAMIRANQLMFSIKVNGLVNGVLPEGATSQGEEEKTEERLDAQSNACSVNVECKTKEQEMEEMNKALTGLQFLKLSGHDPWGGDETQEQEDQEMNKALTGLQSLKLSGHDPWGRDID